MKHIITIPISQMGNTFAIADFHFNHTHKAILTGRGLPYHEPPEDTAAKDYKDGKAASDAINRGVLNRYLIEKYNAYVPEDAIVFNVGDHCLHDPDGEMTKCTLKELNFKTMYVFWGNHNSGMSFLYKETLNQWWEAKGIRHIPDVEIYPLSRTVGKNKKIIFVGNYLTVKIGAQTGPKEGRIPKIIIFHYAIRNWHHNGVGSWMLCGHSHGNDKGITWDTGQRKIMDCGWESIGHPVSFTEMWEKFKTRGTPTYDHH